ATHVSLIRVGLRGGIGGRGAEAQGPHVGPVALDEVEAFGLRAGATRVVPAGRVGAVDGPERVLALVVDDGLQGRLAPGFTWLGRHRGASRGSSPPGCGS